MTWLASLARAAWRYPRASLLAIGAAALVAWRWWSRRQLAAANARTAAAEREREREAGRADVAEAQAGVAADHAVETRAAERAAERIEDVPVTDDPARDRDRLYDALRVLPATDDDHRP